MSVVPVILCGGSGTRMWPLSRGEYPKQFIQLCGEHSLLQQAVLRLSELSDLGVPILVSNQEQRFLLAEQIRQVEVHQAQIMLEPMGRNTAPAVAAAAFLAIEQDPEAVLVVLPSDHVITQKETFQALVKEAVTVAEQGYLVTFGIAPDCPHTGYGYIRRGAPLSSCITAHAVAAFVEKPAFEQAQQYVDSGEYAWNSGMFVFKARAYLEELQRIEPTIFKQVELAIKGAKRDLDFIRLDETSFADCPSNSIDYAVMEHTQKAALLTADDIGWSDVGSWNALADVLPADEHGNNLIGDVMIDGVHNSYLRSDHRLLTVIGLDDVVVVETVDAVLVAHKDKVQQVKNIVQRLSDAGRSEATKHRKVYRPWGHYDSIDSGARFQVKRIVVNPGCSLSLQMHFHRAEHWIVVKGTARIVNGDNTLLLSENQSTYIPIGAVHRLENPGKFPLELIEIQSGGYLGEDDIVRLEDVYGRIEASS